MSCYRVLHSLQIEYNGIRTHDLSGWQAVLSYKHWPMRNNELNGELFRENFLFVAQFF